MQTLLIFAFAAAMSFVGSLQLGPVNLTVIQSALARGRRKALWTAAGGTLPEFFYSAIGVFGAEWILGISGVETLLNGIVSLVLIAVGLLLFFTAPSKPTLEGPGPSGFVRGLGMGLLNPQLLPFWLTVWLQMKTLLKLEELHWVDPWAFVAGTGLGAGALLYLFVELSLRYKAQLLRLVSVNLNRWIGGLIAALGLWGLIKLLL